MKTITLELNKEQEQLLLKKLSKATFRLTEKELTILEKNPKSKNQNTQRAYDSAVKENDRLEAEWKISDSITDQIKKQLGEKNA